MPSGQGFEGPSPVPPVRANGEDGVVAVCQNAVERLERRVPSAHVSCLMRVGETLRVIASSGPLRLIYEMPRDRGGICWRAVETGQAQLIEDVRLDADYVAADENVRAEVAVPVRHGDEGTLVLDAEFPGRPFSREEAEAVQAVAALLEEDVSRPARQPS
jgi:putative methionine-R-sulfoxide reductase with GAF domain